MVLVSGVRGAQDRPSIRTELKRIAARQPTKPIDKSRYRVDPPPSAKQNDEAAWGAALHNAMAQVQHQVSDLGTALFPATAMVLALLGSAASVLRPGESPSSRLEKLFEPTRQLCKCRWSFMWCHLCRTGAQGASTISLEGFRPHERMPSKSAES